MSGPDPGEPEYRQQQASDPYRDIPWLDTLSAEFRGAIPVMDVSIHAYAENPSARLVRINGRIYREGQQVEEELILEAITEEGMIMEYLGQRFRMYVVGR